MFFTTIIPHACISVNWSTFLDNVVIIAHWRASKSFTVILPWHFPHQCEVSLHNRELLPGITGHMQELCCSVSNGKHCHRHRQSLHKIILHNPFHPCRHSPDKPHWALWLEPPALDSNSVYQNNQIDEKKKTNNNSCCFFSDDILRLEMCNCIYRQRFLPLWGWLCNLGLLFT